MLSARHHRLLHTPPVPGWRRLVEGLRLAPIRLGSGTGIEAIRRGEGTGIAEVRRGDGTVLWTAEHDIPNSAIAQYDAQALTGFSDQDPINSWSDKIGSFDLVDGDGFTYDADGINGNPSALADGSDDDLGRDSWGSTVSQPTTIITVTELVSVPSNLSYIHSFQASGGESHQYIVNSDGDYRAFAGSTLVDGAVDTSPTITSVVWDGPSSLIRRNGSQVASGDVGSRPIGDSFMRFGASPGGGTAHTNIYFGEMMVYDDGLSSADLSSEEQRLATKWGITI